MNAIKQLGLVSVQRLHGGMFSKAVRSAVMPMLLCLLGMVLYVPVTHSAVGATCLADTTQSDFLAGVPTNIDLNASPGDATLMPTSVIDQQNTAGDTTGTGFGTSNWTAQTFIPAVTGRLTQAEGQLFCSGCGASPPDLTLSVRATSAGLPTGVDLANTTIPGSTFASGVITSFTATFSTPATLTSGAQYALVLRPVSAPAGSGYFWIRSSPSTYSSGSRVLSTDSGTSWSTDTSRDFNFKIYIDQGYSSGNLVSSLKDAGAANDWDALSWTSIAPANTSVGFQAAGSSNPAGPFNFVGPDGTAATYFQTSGSSLSQFNGLRYLKYKAYLATEDNTLTPTLNDATVCFVPLADLSVTKTDGVTTATAGGSVTYTITASNAGPSDAIGATVADTFPASLTANWTCVGADGGTCTATGSGNIIDTVNLPAGGSVTYTASAVLSAAATGTLSNTVSVAAPAGVTDPNPGNNSATDTDTIVRSADLSITNTDGVTTAAAGGGVTYTITASNMGPSNAVGATVADTFPASLTATWTCVGAGGGTCTAAGSGNINDTVNLPAGGSVTYTASATLSAAATGTLSNTATVAPPAGVTDPNPGNNSATDTDTISPLPRSVGGNVSGLATGKSVVLQNNGGDNLTVSASGAFTFATQVTNGNAYAVTVLTQPADQTCTVSQGSGTMGASNVTNVAVSCVSGTHTVGGNVSGLATGQSVVLQNNGGDNLTVSANGAFTFATQVANGNAYAVTVLTQPADQTCTVSQGNGTMGASNVSNVAVSCVSGTHTVGGAVSGLATGKSVVLQNNGSDNLTVSANGAFTFATPISNGNAYAVTVLTQPADQTCTVSQGSGTMGASNVSNVAVSCVSGLAITTTGFGNLQVGQALSGLQLIASGGSGNYTWSAADAAQPLPAGLSLSASGLLTGAPTAVGNYSTLVTVTDGGGLSKQMSITTKAAGTVSQVFSGAVAEAVVTPSAAAPVPSLGALGIVLLNLLAVALGALGVRWRRRSA